MFVIGNLVGALADLVNALFTIYWWAIIIRILLTWVNPDPFHPLVQFLDRLTEPYLSIFRRFIPPIGPVDVSPIVAVLLLNVFQHFIVRTLIELSIRLR